MVGVCEEADENPGQKHKTKPYEKDHFVYARLA